MYQKYGKRILDIILSGCGIVVLAPVYLILAIAIKVEYTGLRPGEKLYEELLMKEEGLQETANKLIHIGKPIEMDDGEFREQLLRLEEACKDETGNMKDLVAEIVPTYKRKIEV